MSFQKGGLNGSPRPLWALVLDAHLKSSLAAIRSLGKQGVSVCAGSHRSTAMGLYSCYARKSFVYPSPLENCSGFVDAVYRQARALEKCAGLVFSDSTLLPLVNDRSRLSPVFVLVLPSSLADFRTAFDKSCTLQTAESVGLEVPQTFWSTSEGELEEVGRELGYPLVVKPRRTVSWSGNYGTQRTCNFAFSASDLKVKFNAALSETGEIPLLQKYIEGEETGVEFLARDGQPLAACAHRRLRSASPSGGAGVVTETVPLDYRGTGERAERLVAALRWSGPIMVEFKICKETGIPYLIEINGRFWGSLPLATAAGVDFPYIYYRLACEEPVSGMHEYKTGLVSRHFWGDFANLRSVLIRKDPLRSRMYPSRIVALKAFFSSPSYSPAVFDRRDVKPTLAETVDTFRVILMNRLGAANSSKRQQES